MAKKQCDICGNAVGILSQRKLKDGMACYECMEKVGEEFTVPWTNSFSVEQISKAVKGEIKLIPPQVFQCTNGVLIIDAFNRVMYKGLPLGLRSDEISIDSVVGYSYVEDDKKYGVGHMVGTAAVGGMLFGGVGAVIGSVIGANPKRKITHIGVEITYEADNRCELLQANIYKGTPIKASGFTYNGYLETAKLLMGQLDLLMKKAAAAKEQQREVIVQTVSNADEIRKYKALLDEGIITQEEFAVKKKELLGASETIIAKKEYVHQEKNAYEEKAEYEESEEDVERNYSVTLKSTGNKVMAIKAYRELADFGKGIREAKALIDQTPAVIFEGLSKRQADEHVRAFLRTDPTAMLECVQSDI